MWRTQITPAPNAYNPKYLDEKNTPAFTIGRADRNAPIKKTGEITDYLYNPSYTLQTKRVLNTRFSSVPRERQQLRSVHTPGPGHYYINTREPVTPISMSFKEKECIDPLQKTPFRARFLSRELQKLENQGISSPGPKYKQKSFSLDGPQFSFGKPKVDDTDDDDESDDRRLGNRFNQSHTHVADVMYLGYAFKKNRTKGLESPGPIYGPIYSTQEHTLAYSFGNPRPKSSDMSRRYSKTTDKRSQQTLTNSGICALSTSRGPRIGPRSKLNSREQISMKSLLSGIGKDSPGCKYYPGSIDKTSKFRTHSGTKFGGLA